MHGALHTRLSAADAIRIAELVIDIDGDNAVVCDKRIVSLSSTRFLHLDWRDDGGYGGKEEHPHRKLGCFSRELGVLFPVHQGNLGRPFRLRHWRSRATVHGRDH